DERWAVLINEFGDIGIDATRIEDGTAVEELPGGCLCCTLGVPFRAALTRLLRRSQPARLLIEPTGLGHPARILDQLRELEGQGALERRATVTLVDPRQLEEPRIAEQEAFLEQAQVADVLVGHKRDLCTEAQRAAFTAWAEALYPPKGLVVQAAHGQAALSWLDVPTGRGGATLLSEAPPAPHGSQQHTHPHGSDTAPAPERPVRAEQNGGALPACGWLFHRDEVFDRNALLAALEALRGCQRVKGVLRTGRDWLRVDADRDGVRATAAAWRGDSRLEVIGPPEGITWEALEAQLMAALRYHANQETGRRTG
ncbi:MAG: CobW family GTP-binding protein, partial [Halorhodospira sp.]